MTGDQHNSAFNYEVCDAIGQHDRGVNRGVHQLRQSQKRLTPAQTAHMCQQYRDGATVQELSKELGIDRRTVSIRLKKEGVTLRHTIVFDSTSFRSLGQSN